MVEQDRHPRVTRKLLLPPLAGLALIAATIIWLLLDQRSGDEAMPTEEATTISLPQPRRESDTSIEEALLERRSVRSYADGPLTLAQVGQLLWAAQGTTHPRGYRTAPSAGALYPLETYLVVGEVEGMESGVYRYRPMEHDLVLVAPGDKRAALATAALNQLWIRRAAADIVFSAVYERTTKRYGLRGAQYVHMEAGHAAENVYLQAVSLDLATCVIGAFDDDQVKKVMHMPNSEQPLYIMSVGKR